MTGHVKAESLILPYIWLRLFPIESLIFILKGVKACMLHCRSKMTGRPTEKQMRPRETPLGVGKKPQQIQQEQNPRHPQVISCGEDAISSPCNCKIHNNSKPPSPPSKIPLPQPNLHKRRSHSLKLPHRRTFLHRKHRLQLNPNPSRIHLLEEF